LDDYIYIYLCIYIYYICSAAAEAYAVAALTYQCPSLRFAKLAPNLQTHGLSDDLFCSLAFFLRLTRLTASDDHLIWAHILHPGILSVFVSGELKRKREVIQWFRTNPALALKERRNLWEYTTDRTV